MRNSSSNAKLTLLPSTGEAAAQKLLLSFAVHHCDFGYDDDDDHDVDDDDDYFQDDHHRLRTHACLAFSRLPLQGWIHPSTLI